MHEFSYSHRDGKIGKREVARQGIRGKSMWQRMKGDQVTGSLKASVTPGGCAE